MKVLTCFKSVNISHFLIGMSLLIITNCTIQKTISTDTAPVGVVTPAPQANTVTDIDGNVYNTIKIGNQVWMVENLKTTKYNDGTPIGIMAAKDATTGVYYSYEGTDANPAFGKWYNWYAVNFGKLAPKGWHIPTTDEFNLLISTLGANAGGKMKTTTVWLAPNAGADNTSGFSALPAGFKGNAAFTNIGKAAFFWVNNERNIGQANYFKLDYNFATVASNGANKVFGYSVRCVKD